MKPALPSPAFWPVYDAFFSRAYAWSVLKVEFEEAQHCAGYDDSVDPHWLTVAKDGNSTAATIDFEPHTPSTRSQIYFSVDNQATATASPDNATDLTFGPLTVSGHAKGTTSLRARLGSTSGAICSTLNIAVKEEKRVRVDVHFISDTASHASTRDPATVDSFIAGMNAIWTPQANVVFEKGTVDNRTVNGDLGSTVVWSADPAYNEWDDVVATTTGDGDVDVFFVWAWDHYPPGGFGSPQASTFGSNIAMQDAIQGGDAMCLAHEMGHAFGIAISQHTAPAGYLMHGDPAAWGCRINQAENDQANPN